MKKREDATPLGSVMTSEQFRKDPAAALKLALDKGEVRVETADNQQRQIRFKIQRDDLQLD